MAKAARVQIEEKTPGTKIAVRQSGNKIIFGDDDLTIRCDNRQRGSPVTVDVFTDREANLQTGSAEDGYYVAQVEIPPMEMQEVPDTLEGGEDAGPESGALYEPQPIDMSKVRVILWGLDNIPATIRKQLATDSE